MAPATILAAMLTLGRPGASPYSMVDLPECGTNARQKPTICPVEARWDPHWGAWVRRETKDEARARWQRIAATIAQEVRAATRGDAPVWDGSASDLARAVVTVAFHESGFRRDVHAGRGYLGLGDCTTQERVRRCRSFCLMQISTGGPDGEQHGVRGRDLVGVDDEATTRCIAVGIRALAKVKGGGTGKRMFRETIARYGGGSLSAVGTPWVAERVRTFERVEEVTLR